ncbi:hypothetical protein [Streptomyces beihaiensis]|uniref:Uncharacterized protein n=1 Tax=Streptomyces beihaiensis TaxID=2984495 RepID=A0ABT3U1U2_9ACTN|nr:hypothetical protein [Streptomyces beihaiensis]MCX3062671.1 hypothetical protein [Streptomyces beihaiensis]
MFDHAAHTFAYDLHQIRATELIREADAYRAARAARTFENHEPERRVSDPATSGRGRRLRFTRAA